jgi:hypothetical protein
LPCAAQVVGTQPHTGPHTSVPQPLLTLPQVSPCAAHEVVGTQQAAPQVSTLPQPSSAMVPQVLPCAAHEVEGVHGQAAPQVSVWPQLSEMVPQVLPCAAQVVGVQQTFGETVLLHTWPLEQQALLHSWVERQQPVPPEPHSFAPVHAVAQQMLPPDQAVSQLLEVQLPPPVHATPFALLAWAAGETASSRVAARAARQVRNDMARALCKPHATGDPFHMEDLGGRRPATFAAFRKRCMCAEVV